MPSGGGETLEKSPYGKTLLGKDSKANRRLFRKGTKFGNIPVAASICDGDRCPYYNYKEDAADGTKDHERRRSERPIHVLIASFRDRLCPRTLHNAFRRAKNPHRIFIRIIDQSKPGSELIDDAGCWDRYCKDYDTGCKRYEKQVRTVHVDSSKARGPTHARSKLSAMVHWDYVHGNDGEVDLHAVDLNDFCMQIDSHMDFSDDYDDGLIGMFHRTENDYAVLSTYVTDIEHNNKENQPLPNLCMVMFTSSIRNWGTKQCTRLVRPKLTNAMWGAGLSFHRCHAEINVPVDPYLDGVFDGEEGSRGIRFFTHGYDVYTPDRVLVTHDYHTHQSNPIVHTWGNRDDGDRTQGEYNWEAQLLQARPTVETFGSSRLNMLLGIGSHHNSTEDERNELAMVRSSRYGIGTKRTLAQVDEFTGIDLLHQKMVENKCGNLVWVPYQESPDYGVPRQLARRYAREVGAPPTLRADGGEVGREPADEPPEHHGVASRDDHVLSDPGKGGGVGGGGGDAPRLRRSVGDADPDTRLSAVNRMLVEHGLSGWVLVFLLIVAARLIAHKGRSKNERHKN